MKTKNHLFEGRKSHLKQNLNFEVVSPVLESVSGCMPTSHLAVLPQPPWMDVVQVNERLGNFYG